MKKATKFILKHIGQGEAPVWAIVDGLQQRIYVKEGESFEVTEKIYNAYKKYKKVYDLVEGPDARKSVVFPKNEAVDEIAEVIEETTIEVDPIAEEVVEQPKPAKKKK